MRGPGPRPDRPLEEQSQCPGTGEDGERGQGDRTCDPQAMVRIPRRTAQPRHRLSQARRVGKHFCFCSGHKELADSAGGTWEGSRHHCGVLLPRLPPLPDGGPFFAAGGPGLTTMWRISGQGCGMDGVLFISRGGLNNGAVV